MKPAAGVAAELLVLALILGLGVLVPAGLPFAAYIVLAELLATYLIHCPAHYVVGSVFGIRFTSIRLGRTALARVLPPRLAGLARLLPILTLSSDKASLKGAGRTRVAAMYASGTVASVASAFVISTAALAVEPSLYGAAALGVAVSYLLFDLAFSPRSGDLYRARNALKALAR